MKPNNKIKQYKSLIWGLFFILIAAFVIVGSLGYFGEISVWTIIFAGALAIWFAGGLMHLSWGNILFPLAFAAILFDEALGIEELTPWPVLAAALFGTIGLSMIFKKKKKEDDWMGHIGVKTVWDDEHCMGNGEKKFVEEMSQDDTTFISEVVFSSSVRYITCQNLQMGKIENVFSNSTIYFDNAQLCKGHAVVKIECVFGKTTLYIPKEWYVDLRATKVFGSVNEKGKYTGDSGNTLVVEGEAVFGNLEIIYV